jgi:hypothetical protein
MGSQQQLGASTSAIPAAATPANLPAAHRKGNFYTITATFGQARYNKLMKSNKERRNQLESLGCSNFVLASGISERCNTMQGQYLGNEIYAYRNLAFNGHSVNAYRRIDPSGNVMDFRLLAIKPGATPQGNGLREQKIIESMESGLRKGIPLRMKGLESHGKTPDNRLSYPLSNNCTYSMRRYEKDFVRLGITIPGDVVGLVRRCEAAVNKVRPVNIVELTTTAGAPFHVAWITCNDQTVGLLVPEENQGMQDFEVRARSFSARSSGQFLARS